MSTPARDMQQAKAEIGTIWSLVKAEASSGDLILTEFYQHVGVTIFAVMPAPEPASLTHAQYNGWKTKVNRMQGEPITVIYKKRFPGTAKGLKSLQPTETKLFVPEEWESPWIVAITPTKILKKASLYPLSDQVLGWIEEELERRGG